MVLTILSMVGPVCNYPDRCAVFVFRGVCVGPSRVWDIQRWALCLLDETPPMA